MRPVSFVADWFIDFFGITHPSDRQRKLATWFIACLLIGTVLAFAGIFLLLFHLIRP